VSILTGSGYKTPIVAASLKRGDGMWTDSFGPSKVLGMAPNTAALDVRIFGESAHKGHAAMRDLVVGLYDWHLWTSLGWLDVKQRYRRAVLGPFWITISMCVFVFALGIVYAGIFRQDTTQFLPYLAAGFIVWNLIAATVNESTLAFVQAEGLIKQGGIPLSLHMFRVVFRNLVVGAHNFTVMLLLYIWQPGLLSWNLLLAVPALVLVFVNLTWISMLVGVLCTRYRDLPPIIANLMQIIFFLSPIMYKPSALPARLSFIADANPVFYFVDAVRGPLLGEAPPVRVYALLVVFAFIGWIATFRLFQVARSRVPYWV
jgi:ABC-type polysaccharide/polyol phosphate export permease